MGSARERVQRKFWQTGEHGSFQCCRSPQCSCKSIRQVWFARTSGCVSQATSIGSFWFLISTPTPPACNREQHRHRCLSRRRDGRARQQWRAFLFVDSRRGLIYIRVMVMKQCSSFWNMRRVFSGARQNTGSITVTPPIEHRRRFCCCDSSSSSSGRNATLRSAIFAAT